MDTNIQGDSWPCGRGKLIPNIVDQIAHDHPDASYAEVPLSPDTFTTGFRKISYRDFSNAINGMAWWMEQSMGRSESFETLVYLGPNDMRHIVLLLAAVKSGYKMLFTSPRYSELAQINLIKQLDCKTMLVPAIRPPITNTILTAYNMRTLQIPELDSLLDSEHAHYPYNKTFKQARDEPLVALHTSGTTGFPKPIIWTHDWADSFAAERYLKPPPNFESLDSMMLGVRLFSIMPPFHAAHLFGSLLFSIYCGTTMIYPLAALPPSAAMVADGLHHTTADAITMVPPYIEELGANPKILDNIVGRVKTVMWAGGDVSHSAGHAISSKLQLFTSIGSTEAGLWPLLRHAGTWSPDFWHYFYFHPEMNIKLVPQSDGIFEAVIHRNVESDAGYVQPIFKYSPQLREHPSGDLFTPHPTEKGFWKYFGRADDMQVFRTGEKYHPIAVEAYITQHPDVGAALLIGAQRNQAALLLELTSSASSEDASKVAEMIDKIWPTVEEANKMCPAYAQVTKHHVLFTNKDKPMARTAKGTVQRNETADMYLNELDNLYAKAAAESAPVPQSAYSLLTAES